MRIEIIEGTVEFPDVSHKEDADSFWIETIRISDSSMWEHFHGDNETFIVPHDLRPGSALEFGWSNDQWRWARYGFVKNVSPDEIEISVCETAGEAFRLGIAHTKGLAVQTAQ